MCFPFLSTVFELLFHRIVSYRHLHYLNLEHTKSSNHLFVKLIMNRKLPILLPELYLVGNPKIHRQNVEELKINRK